MKIRHHIFTRALVAFSLVAALPGFVGAQVRDSSGQQKAQQLDAVKARAARLHTELQAQTRYLQSTSLDPVILARHRELVAELGRRAGEYDRAVAAWKANPSDATLKKVDELLARYRARSASAPSLPSVLPWGAPKAGRRLPAQSQSAWYRILTRDERIQLAQAGSLTTLGGIRFTKLPEPGLAPQDADLAESAEVVLTAAIRAKAKELGGNPVNIVNWVRNSVQFVPTWGAVQDADTTLRSMRGNAIDTASLTIALLRAAGIPARYQFGTVDVPAAEAMNWLGGLNRPEAALELLQQGGIAARGLDEGGQIATIRMEHAWVSAYVNWLPSRGARQGGAQLVPPQHPNPNAALNAWVPLDAAFKQHQFSAGLSGADIAPFNAPAVIDSARQGAACTNASAAGINQASLAAHYAQFKTQAQQQLAAMGSDVRVASVLGNTSIVRRQMPLLAGTLAVPTVVADTAVAELPSALRWRLQLGLVQGMDRILALDKPLPDIQGRLLSLSFIPETVADAQALATLMRPTSGGDSATGLPGSIAAYLVKFKAQLRLDGQLVSEGGSFTLGQTLTLRSLVQNPQGNAGSAEATVTVGETHVWAVQGQAQGAGIAATVAQRLQTLRSQLDATSLPAAQDQSNELLFGVASAYQAGLDAKARLYQRVAGAVELRLPSVVRASSRLEADEVLGLIVSVRPAGVGLHGDRLGSAVASRTGTSADGYGRQSLERASAEAHHLLNALFGPSGAGAQSALSGLASAAAQGQTLWRADAVSIGQVLAALDAGSTVRGQLEQSTANGLQALVASSYVDLGGLPMDPLVLLDPQAGTAAYSVTSRNVPVVQLTAQRPGLGGWLGLADAQATRALALPVLDAAVGRLNTTQALLGDIDSISWKSFAGQAEVIDGLYVSRISEAARTDDACGWVIALLSSQLGGGLPSTQRVNQPPVITSAPALTAVADLGYGYQVIASDPDGDALSYALVGAPAGMTMDATGRLDWPRASAGQFAITVQVSDGQSVIEQPFTLTVSGTPAALQLAATLSPTIANAGQTVTLTVSATSGRGDVTLSATLDGAPLALDAQGVTTFAAPASGAHRVLVTASDARGSTTREIILTILNASDTTAPQAAITGPQADAGLRGMAAITGTASDANFAYYQLLLRRAGEPDTAWKEVGRGLTQVINGTLGQIDTSRYDNGLYQIGLRVVDVNGAQTTASVTVEFLSNLKLGQFRLSFADVRTEAMGLPLLLTRTYDSSKKDVMGDFGYGWSASGQDISVRKNMTFGQAWEITQQQFQLCLRPVGKRRISITLPDGGLYRFDGKNAQECAFAQVPELDIQFTAVPGPTGGAAGRVSAGGQLRAIDGALVMAQGGMLVDMDTGEPWNPKDFELTTEEGVKYQLREGVGILSVTDPWGNKVSYGPNGYQHSANLGLSFSRDAAGRITRATDPTGKSLSYAYNAQGELESVTDRQGQVTRFAYATVTGVNSATTSGNQDQKHLLASITDPTGKVVMNNQFDQYGRLTGTADALGQAAQQEFDPANYRQTVTDRRGNKSVYTFDADGNITQVVNALGQTTSFTFDANGNETSTTNALGETTTRTFDSATGKQLSERNPLGQTTSTSYASSGLVWQRGNPLSTTDARGNVTSYSYADQTQPGATPSAIAEPLGRSTSLGLDAKGNLRGLNIAGEALSFEYDDKGRKTKETNGLGQVTSYTYDTAGNETSRTVTKTVGGQVVSLTTTRKYDAENRLIEETDPLGGKRVTTYNAAGKVATQTDSLGRATRYSYDANARLTRTDYPDGTAEQTSYDAEGNETAKTDRAGRSTRYTYDGLNRLTRTDHPDGSFEATEYDAAGRVVATTDRRGKRSTVEYDAAGRQTASVDASGLRTSQTYDANGNRTSVTIDGRTTRYEYDALNRLTKTTWPDGSTHSSVYRADNRKQSETDPRGVTTRYSYDAAGRLTSVAQSLSATASATTTYAYDETGAKTTQVDALGRTTTWTLDGNGRITSRTIQDGTRESSRYDAEGNRLAKTTFAGETFSYQYESENRLTGQIVPPAAGGQVPGASVTYQYTASGQLKAQTEQGATTLNGTLSYTYDAGDRLVGVTSPIGQISYGLDAAGNITERSVPGVGTTRSDYDAAGRLVKVTAPDGKEARYSYDAAGRHTTTERDLNPKDGHAQTLVSYKRYDNADRTIAMAEVKRTGASETLIAGQALTRTTGGTITKIDTYRAGSYDAASGQFQGTPTRTQAFEYDGNARLTRETNTQGATGSDTAYEYDAAGNRTKKTQTTAAGTEITTYSYDQADRLTQESTSLAAGGSRTTTYEWDGNGNLKAKTEPGKVTLHRFDAQNRLIDIRTGATKTEASAAIPSVSYAYDAAGNRIRKGGAQATSYLIDPSHTYAQVALETKGSESTAYVRGLELIRQSKVGGSSVDQLFPLHGHLGTSVGAVDADGNVVEQLDADAFGDPEQATGLKQAHFYTGEYWDQDSQLLYLRARWYDPRIGRFVAADPFEGQQTDPRSLNRYGFVHANPVHNTDPTGAMSLGDAGAAMNIMSTLAVNTLRDIGMNMVMEQVGKTLISAFGAKHTVGNWGGSPGGAALVSVLANLCYFNERTCLLRGIPTLANGVEMPATTFHILESLSGEASTRFGPGRALPFLLSRVPRQSDGWLDKVCPKPRPVGFWCDEYPYASTLQGGPVNYMAGGVSGRLVPKAEQVRQRSVIWRFYSGAKVGAGGVTPDSFFLNVVTPLPSFYIDRNGKKHSLMP